MGPASVLGTRFEAYTNLMRQQISQHWSRSDVHASASQRCAITFTIARNGTVGNVQISHPSGKTWPFVFDAYAQESLVHGLDEVARTLKRDEAIAAYEAGHPGRFDARSVEV